MAGNKLNAKARGKDDRGKGVKSIVPNNEEEEEEDFSLLRKPVHTSVTSFGQARKIFDLATEELKGLLSEECDLLYECRVCRNLFRSLANFISHKRVYCKEKFNSTVHGHFIKSSTTLTELSKIKRMEEGYQEWLKEYNDFESMDTDEVDERVPLTKDLTAVVEKLSNNKGVRNIKEEPQLSLQKIPHSNVAVFQNVDKGEEYDSDMSTQVNELDTMLSRNVAVLQKDGRFKIQSGSSNDVGVIQISDEEDMDDLKCKKCSMQFSTAKTLKFHMKYKHVESRLVYPCPDCLEIFSTSWSVYRHLFKVHRKTAAQVRRLRESIQAKAFKMNNPPAFYEKRKNTMKAAPPQKITEEERLDQENQAWMDNMELESSIPRCGGCGRGFERRAALAAHAHTCAPRVRALRRQPTDTKRIEIQIRRDYNKGPTGVKIADVIENKTKDKEETKSKETKEEPEVQENEIKKAEEESAQVVNNEEVDENSVDSVSNQSNEDKKMESPEKHNSETGQEVGKMEQVSRLPFAQHAEKSNLMAFRQRVIGDIELDKLQCKKCEIKCENIQQLYDHVAKHYKWLRYACKLCNFKHYNFEKLPEHVKVVHKLKGDKDFYFSTVKALDGQEATDLAEPVEETAEDESNPNSRRPSRCSSDSSRVSDDSSSSSTKIEGDRKRKLQKGQIPAKGLVKRRKSAAKANKEDEWPDKDDSLPNEKGFEENSSDMDDLNDKTDKKVQETTPVQSRRPVRRKTKPKHADFEYDLSNLLKMEMQGYRESQTVVAKTIQTKKKSQPDPPEPDYDILNKEYCGALSTLSRRAVETFRAHPKTSFSPQKEKVPANIFARPMIPKILAKGDKPSPKKDAIEEKKDISNTNKETDKDSTNNLDKDATNVSDEATSSVEQSVSKDIGDSTQNRQEDHDEQNSLTKPINILKSKQMPSVVPVKLRRQLDVMKNPIINKNINDFTKAGMKTKILVIKPINRNRDGTQALNSPLKFQTIKLKEASKISNEDKPSDQVVVVKVPKVDTRTLPDTSKLLPNDKPKVTTENSTPDKTTVIPEKLDSKETSVPTNEESSPEIAEKSDSSIEKSPEVDSCVLDTVDANSKTNVNEESIVITQISSPTRDECAHVVIMEKSTESVVKSQSNTHIVNEPALVETNGVADS